MAGVFGLFGMLLLAAGLLGILALPGYGSLISAIVMLCGVIWLAAAAILDAIVRVEHELRSAERGSNKR